MRERFSLIAFLAICLAISGCGNNSQDAASLPEFCKQDGSRLYIKQGKIRMEIMPKIAARISSLQYAGHEFLVTDADQSAITDWGTVLWSSPQAEWQWPPIDTLDSKPYTLGTEEDRLVLTSGIDPKTGYQFTKTYMPAGDDRIAVTYRITNHSAQTKKVAPLEVTRLPPRGSLFYPAGDTEVTSGIFYPLNVQAIGDLTWYDYDAKKIRTDHHKSMQDGKEGWVAYVDKNYLLVKEFVDTPASGIADGEREIELFTHVEHIFIEMKQQGASVELAPGEHLDWTVIWHVKKLPDELAESHDPLAVASYVRSLL
ncbi:YidC/Oxa1 family insertase periplasmic-domain containing protein [Cellvibrio sp. NN19]|uniref:YidC/Oxa1 family insertase periplasmic-domain containing protein n=1 Tax=Cellvibrio chitinivorans TaxID=3102792 RepID=UPI002B40ACE4|nr:YidC/Oxa1 family insertase periplasmic-domain containing protein [Cellvibrio sp. NN19]